MEINKSINRLIKEFSIERNFWRDAEESEREIRRIGSRLRRGETADSLELAGEEAEDFAVFYLYQEGADQEAVKEKILAHIADEHKYRLYYVVIFTDTFEKKVRVKGWGQEIRNAIKKKVKCGISGIIYQVLSCQKHKQKKFMVDIGSRMNGIEMSPEAERGMRVGETSIAKKVRAFTYTAKLHDIVQIYNEIGDELFQRNVRYGIKDQLEVEENIKRTLRENPEDFWFLNNGITIIVQGEKGLDHSKNSRIGLEYGKDSYVSVINGAQTISTAADFWYESTGAQESTDEEEIRSNAREQARVLLRIMYVPEAGQQCQKELDHISISLNRQKPIKSEDIAYTSPVIMEINQLYQSDERDDFHFCITKRGEDTLGKYKYNLTDFARAVKAYKFQKPGEARTQSANRILQYQPGAPESVYVDEMLEQDADAVFMKHYKPTNFAMRALAYYKEAGKRIAKAEDSYEAVILGNGRYYFTAYLVHVLRGTAPDFTEFSGNIEALDEHFDELLQEYLRLLNKIAEEYVNREQEDTIDSNTFKTEALYQELIGYQEAGEDQETKEELEKLEERMREYLS